MTEDERKELCMRMRTLVVFRAVLDDPVIAALVDTLGIAAGLGHDDAPLAEAYAGFVSELFATGTCSLGAHVQEVVLDDENVYLRRRGARAEVPRVLADAADAELQTLARLAALAPDDLLAHVPASLRGTLARYEVERTDLVGIYRERLADIHRHGFGVYARHHVFRMDDAGQVVPVHHPDPIRLADLADYEREKGIILDNTRALLAGRPAANILLTGDAGTGKSSTVKAVANELASEGLRILEVHKEQLHRIPGLLDELTKNPLCFVIFIDDLSFARDDDNFAALKAILEGSVSAKSANVAIYATSNRRHLVRETFSDREGDDVHLNDTLQEIVSLSDRFGIHVSFHRPDKATYLDIVHQLAEADHVTMDEGELDLLAKRFATRRGGRSARGARQFIDSLVARQ